MNTYPHGWPEFANMLKSEAGWKCERCNHPHDPLAIRPCGKNPVTRAWETLPDYLNDLNAMAEAEEILDGRQWSEYGVRLEKNYLNFPKWREMNCSTVLNIGLVHATAAQRAEAFLRTLGKWEES